MANVFLLAMASAVLLALANSAPAVVSIEMSQPRAKPVNVTAYFESLCPGCHDFTAEVLPRVWAQVKDLDLMTVNLLPYGNAEEKKLGFGWEFTCQHGKEECEGNIVETCMIHHYPDTTEQLKYVACFEKDFYNSFGVNWKQSLKNCAHTGVDVEKIQTCAAGKEGNDLEHIVATKTGPHTEAPWVMLDGVWNREACDHLLIEVCKAYTGTPPDVCNQ